MGEKIYPQHTEVMVAYPQIISIRTTHYSLTSPRLHYVYDIEAENTHRHVQWYYPPMHNRKRDRNISDSHVRTEKTEKPYKIHSI